MRSAVVVFVLLLLPWLAATGEAYVPSPVAVSATAGRRVVELDWESPGNVAVDTYRVYRSLRMDAGFKVIAAVKTTSFRDTGVAPGKTYYYRVNTVIRGGESVAGDTVEAVPGGYKPAPPSGLTASATDRSVRLAWTPNREQFFDHYAVYAEAGETEGEGQEELELLAETWEASFAEESLEPETSYAYWVTVVSTDGVESEPAEVEVLTSAVTKPPLEIEVVEMRNIFSNNYKAYEQEGVGTVRIINNTADRISRLKLSFTVKEFMDFPTDLEVTDLPPGEHRDLALKAVFSNRILEVSEDTPVQAEIVASYYLNEELKSYSRSLTLMLHEKHRMVWNRRDMAAVFVTPKDPPVLEFARDLASRYSDMANPLVYGGVIFDALGAEGLTYLQDPNNPYQITSGQTDFADYVQFPRETLQRRSGDCDDLVMAYSALLESLGIRTMLLDYPGHMFMMFAIGTVQDLGGDTMGGMLVIHDGLVWVPVETTLVGSPFMKAWETGGRGYAQWSGKGLGRLDLRRAWEKFKPATLPPTGWRPRALGRDELERTAGDEPARLGKIWLKHANGKYFQAAFGNPADYYPLLQLGIAYGEAGETEEALKFLRQADGLAPDRAEVKNNIGNLLFLRGDCSGALKAYERAAELDPADGEILVNMALVYLKQGQRREAGEAFARACRTSREVCGEHRALSLELAEGI